MIGGHATDSRERAGEPARGMPWRAGWRAIAVASLVLVAGCGAFLSMRARAPDSPERTWEFDHGIHEARFLDGGCDMCHAPDAQDSRFVGSPGRETCRLCHHETFGDAPPGDRTRVMPSFDHRVHEVMGVPCRSCHAAVEQGDSPPPEMDGCLGCHRDTGVGGRSVRDCSACHGEPWPEGDAPPSHWLLVGSPRPWPAGGHADEMPPSHDQHFRRVGHAALAERESRCAPCHAETSCSACHREMRPRDHGPRWRRTAHGRAAAHDRRRCAACHHADDCAGCHEAAPRDHDFAFRERGGHADSARTRLRSCLVCHPTASDCERCHFP